MIEFEGWIFDFDNMDCLSPGGGTMKLMKLDDTFYICTGYAKFWGPEYKQTWNYPFNSMKLNKQLYREYEAYLVEKFLLADVVE